MPRKIGRTTKLNPQTQQKIIDAITAGNYLETAANYANISKTTLYRWLAEAEQPNAPKRLREFRDAVEQARAAAEVRNVTLVQRAANDGSWQAASWYLERSFPARWGKNQKVEVTGADGAPLKLDVSVDELASKIEGLLGDGGPKPE